jgi:hypothetical protein
MDTPGVFIASGPEQAVEHIEEIVLSDGEIAELLATD